MTQQPTEQDHFYGYFTDENGQEWLITDNGLTGYRVYQNSNRKLFVEDTHGAFRALNIYQDALDDMLPDWVKDDMERYEQDALDEETEHKLWTDSLNDQASERPGLFH